MKTETVWGLAAGVQTTKNAARGAFTVREYPAGKVPEKDWLRIIAIVPEDKK
jgi:hypothetical protein